MSGRIDRGSPSVPKQVDSTDAVESNKQAETKPRGSSTCRQCEPCCSNSSNHQQGSLRNLRYLEWRVQRNC